MWMSYINTICGTLPNRIFSMRTFLLNFIWTVSWSWRKIYVVPFGILFWYTHFTYLHFLKYCTSIGNGNVAVYMYRYIYIYIEPCTNPIYHKGLKVQSYILPKLHLIPTYISYAHTHFGIYTCLYMYTLF